MKTASTWPRSGPCSPSLPNSSSVSPRTERPQCSTSRMTTRCAQFAGIVELLAVREAEFIVVGMTASVLQGARVTTLVLDLVQRGSPEIVARMLRVLESLDAVYRHGAGRL